MRLGRSVCRLRADDRGQDLIEYALLCGLLATGALLAFPAIRDNMSAAYGSWVSEAQAIWEPCPPAPASCS